MGGRRERKRRSFHSFQHSSSWIARWRKPVPVVGGWVGGWVVGKEMV